MDTHAPALLVAAHGSSNPGWADRLREFAAHVGESPGVADVFGEVRVAFLEGTPPTIPDAVRARLAAGAGRVLVAPLFLTASTHLGEDLPGLLGLPVPEHVRRRLVGEGQRPLAAGLPVTLLDLGPLDAILGANVQRRLLLRADDPSEEAVVLVAYGSSVHHARWEALLRDVRARLMAAGYAYACHAYVGHVVGMSPEPTAKAVARAGRMAGVRRVHVVPLLMSVGPLQTRVIAAAARHAATEAKGRFRVLYTPDAILPDGDLAAHVGAAALEALGLFPAQVRSARA